MDSYKQKNKCQLQILLLQDIGRGKKMEELVVKAKKGDKEAFTQIVLILKEDLYKIAKTRITNEADIEDAIQETMIEAYKSIKKIKDVSKIKQWIIKY